jgi:malate dehydrogenase (oxaloacetate-decarboxylating)
MFVAAARALARFSPALNRRDGSLFPALEDVRKISRNVAIEVAREAVRAALAEGCSEREVERRVDANMWEARYVRYRRKR